MKKTLIFSDVHLKATPEDQPRHAEFITFLGNIDPAQFDRLVCLGDLFDFWFEYRHVIFSEYFKVLRAFAELRDAGLEMHLICGNHDFWAGRFLRDTLQFNIHQDGIILPFGEKKVLFVHGDGINPRDRSYRFYKRFARHPWIIRAFACIHPDWAMRIAQGVSHGSRTMLQVKDTANGPEARALRAYAEEAVRAGTADVVMCGHAHAPAFVPITREGAPDGLYINTGDWLHHRTHVVWDGESFQLFPAPEPPLR